MDPSPIVIGAAPSAVVKIEAKLKVVLAVANAVATVVYPLEKSKVVL